MPSPKEALMAAILAWIEDDARERVARARGDDDADSLGRVAARHEALRLPRARERFEEARERGFLSDDELRASAAWMREAYASPGRARALERVAAVLGSRVPHDSDHHAPIALLSRMLGEAHEGRRRAIARSLESFAPELERALSLGMADIEESSDGAAWLRDIAAPPDAPIDLLEPAREILRLGEDAFREALARAAHRSSVRAERWPDLLFVLRGAELDSLVDARGRFRRIAERFAALGVHEALGKRARTEPRSRLTTEVVALSVPRDVRILPSSLEHGVASERAAAIAIGRAAAIAWTHPALPAIVARPLEGSIGRALGALLAHTLSDTRARGDRAARALAEHALLVELAELRTEAAVAIARRSIGSRELPDTLRDAFSQAWCSEVTPSVAACVALRVEPHPLARLRASRWAAPLYAALRERFDDDFWKNPRAAEPLRAAASRGSTLSIEAFAAELDAKPEAAWPRYAELLG
jgi:hypothetical protein